MSTKNQAQSNVHMHIVLETTELPAFKESFFKKTTYN